MKSIWNRCRRRPEISLLAAGALGEAEKIEVQNHLAVCETCQSYYREIKSLTTPLKDWERNLSPIEVTPAARESWFRAVQANSRPSVDREPPLPNFWQILWLELIRPSRFAWLGMAAAWAIMLAVHGQFSDHQITNGETHAASTAEMRQAWEEQNRVLAELSQPTFGMPAAPSALPRPRSEMDLPWKMI